MEGWSDIRLATYCSCLSLFSIVEHSWDCRTEEVSCSHSRRAQRNMAIEYTKPCANNVLLQRTDPFEGHVFSDYGVVVSLWTIFHIHTARGRAHGWHFPSAQSHKECIHSCTYSIVCVCVLCWFAFSSANRMQTRVREKKERPKRSLSTSFRISAAATNLSCLLVWEKASLTFPTLRLLIQRNVLTFLHTFQNVVP